MKELLVEDGDLIFVVSDKERGFLDKIKTTIKCFDVELFYNRNLGVSFDVITGEYGFYKASHIIEKLNEIFMKEAIFKAKNITLENSVVKCEVEYFHKTFKTTESFEVMI